MDNGGRVSGNAIVVNRRGRKIHYNPHDERGIALAKADGNLNPQSLVLWNTALGLTAWDVVVDVGCNYGEMLVGADLPPTSRVIAFEPNPRILPYLTRTLKDFGREVDLREVAIGQAEAVDVEFAVDVDWSGTSSLDTASTEVAAHRNETIRVKVSTLDAELADSFSSSICMKVDVEGYEKHLIEGALTLLGSVSKWALLFEILHMPIPEIAELAERFSMYLLDRRTGRLVPVQGRSTSMLGRLLSSGWIYPQDALIVSTPDMVRATTKRGTK